MGQIHWAATPLSMSSFHFRISVWLYYLVVSIKSVYLPLVQTSGCQSGAVPDYRHFLRFSFHVIARNLTVSC